MTEAGRREGQYEWMAAAELYEKVLDQVSPGHDPNESVQVTDLLGRSYFRAAFQSETREEFKRRMGLSEAFYQRAEALYEKLGLETVSKRSKARGVFATFWLEDNPSERKNLIAESISLAEGVVEIQGRDNRRLLAETYEDLLSYYMEAYRFAPEWSSLRKQFDRALEIGGRVIEEFETLGEDEDLLESLHMTLYFLTVVSWLTLGPNEYRELSKRREKMVSKLWKLSERIGTPYALSLANEGTGQILTYSAGQSPGALQNLEAAILAAQATKDRYVLGRILVVTGDTLLAAQMREDDMEKKRTLLEKGIQLSSSAIANLEIPLHGYMLDWAYNSLANCYITLATFVETKIDRKIDHLRKAVDISKRGLAYKDHLNWPASAHALSKAIYFLASMDSDAGKKKQLLEESIAMVEENVRREVLCLPHSPRLSTMLNYQALLKAELSRIAGHPETRLELLEGAVSDLERAVARRKEWAIDDIENMSVVALYDEQHGDILVQLHQLSATPIDAQRALGAYEDSIVYLAKSGHIGPVGQVRWKIAKVRDSVGDFEKASQDFKNAAEEYRLAAKKIPGLSSVFEELATYMDAWSLIEKARVHHNEEQFLAAAESYTQAASILGKTKSWVHLTNYYNASSVLEHGEALSREERPEGAVESFSAALDAFRKATAEMGVRLRGMSVSQDNQELTEWLGFAKYRERYCEGRLDLEEARVSDRKGEKSASLAKYRASIAVFRALREEAQNERDGREIESLVAYCEALATMNEAESKASSELYSKAAEWFARAKETATRERFHLLALAYSSICRALEAGTRFRLTRDPALYSEIKKHLETAADYYTQAGLEKAADWTRATQRLFDALVYLARAEVEEETKKKTELYHLAEKHLELASKLYGETGYASKKEEVLRHLRRVREEKQVLLSPIEALAENPTFSGASVASISLTQDRALGLERFESANVVGNLTVSQRELEVGGKFLIELEIANVGKTAATLVKLEDIVLEGLEIDRARISHRVEDSFIDMKGKRLEYLKTHEVKIPMTALQKGTFELRPRVLFVDEKGTYRSYQFEPAALRVRELGISRWLKGR